MLEPEETGGASLRAGGKAAGPGSRQSVRSRADKGPFKSRT